MAVTDYNKKKKLDVDSVSGTPTVGKAQPILLVDGDDSTTGNGDIVIDFTNVSDASDIAVYDQNGNLLDYEIEELDITNETAVLWAYNSWVRDGSTQAQVVYGDGDTDRQNVTGTWGNTGQNAVMVQHLQDDPLTATDSTSNNNDGTVSGASSTTGEFDGAASFDGTDDNIDYGNTSAFGTTDGTLIVWANPDAIDEQYPAYGTGVDHGYYLRIAPSSDGPNDTGESQWLWKVDDSSNDQFFTSQLSNGVNSGEYYHLGMVMDRDSNLIGYLDGGQSNSGDMSNVGDIDTGSSLLQANVPGGEFGGVAPSPMDMDSFRTYSDVKSSEWIQADYDASPKAGQVFFSQQAAETTVTTETKTFSQDISIKDEDVTEQLSTDIIVENQNVSEQFTQDVNIQATDQEVTFNNDTTVKDENVEVTFTQDATLLDRDAEKTLNTDVSVKDENVEQVFDQDVILSAGNQALLTTDVSVKAEDQTKQLSTDLILENANVPEQFTQDVAIKDGDVEVTFDNSAIVADTDQEKTFSQDVYVSQRMTAELTTDVVIAKKPAPDVTNPLTVNIQTDTRTYVKNLNPSKTKVKVKDIDL